MTTAYVAAEKFIQWREDGQLVIDESLADAISSHRKNHRFVIYFAPARFGLWLEDRREVEEAWHYLESSLKATGMPVQEVMLFDHDVDVVRFRQDMQDHPEEQVVIVSDDEKDANMSRELNVRCLHEIPANISGMWQKLSIRRMLRTLVAAAFSA